MIDILSLIELWSFGLKDWFKSYFLFHHLNFYIFVVEFWYGIQTKKGVYSLCYIWDNEKMVEQLAKLEQSGQKIELSGNQSDRFTIDCDSIKIK